LVSRAENALKSAQRLQIPIFRLSNLIHELAKPSSQLGNENIAYNTLFISEASYILYKKLSS